MMQKYFLTLLMVCLSMVLVAQPQTVCGPDRLLRVELALRNGIPVYSVMYKNKLILEESPLGLVTNVGDFSRNMVWQGSRERVIDTLYSQNRIKASRIHVLANELVVTLSNVEQKKVEITFRVSNHDVAFRYSLPQYGETACCVIEKEMTGFDFPEFTTTFLCPQSAPMIGWKRSKPSYEEEYTPDEPVGTPSRYGCGYTFPCLFHVGENGWALISETGVGSRFCGSHLSEGSRDGLYTIAFPNAGENNGIGSVTPVIALPGETPWRTITVGDQLKPIVETTVAFDVVEPLYEPLQAYRFGRSTWSWIMWQDRSVCYEDQVQYIDLAAAMGYEYVLIDGLWDTQIGYQRMPELFRYAQSKGVDVFLWYNSNGYWNDAPQGARHRMDNSIARKKEMKWLQSQGVKGLKVDFFGGDKQETMKLYEDILSDANEYGLMVIFHGCTLPRGWERMYPNYVGSEAVLASENLIFNQHFDDNEAFNACLHPFIRNAVGSMEFGPVLLNKRYNRNNDGGRIRRTTDVFQLATAILFQNPIQNFAIAPNNLTDVPAFEIDFMKQVPTTWDEIRFIDGYPGKYCILARRRGEQWYIAGVNAGKEVLKKQLDLPMLAGQKVVYYRDDKNGVPRKEEMVIGKKGRIELTIQPNGGVVLHLRDKKEILSMIDKANHYWQTNHPQPGWAFWHVAAYHTGNMEAYKLTKNEAYRAYSEAWADHNLWMGARTKDKSLWKYSYGAKNDYVLFGDWQICFQTYIDLYHLQPDPHKIERAREVMEYQISTPNRDYWWWADGLYMVMPVMTKMYRLTGNPLFLEKLHEYLTYADSIMYDSEACLYYRDAKYVYPKHKTVNGKKDFWARGDGWVFAGLAKVLTDLPEHDPFRDEYIRRFQSMAKAIASCQQKEGYWTRSLLDPEFAPGRETSGTAFFTYGLLWGINHGILDADTYLPVALKGWEYLSTIALQPDGRVGYVQPVGEKAIPGQVVDANSTEDFGVGAFLLAACEMVRYLTL